MTLALARSFHLFHTKDEHPKLVSVFNFDAHVSGRAFFYFGFSSYGVATDLLDRKSPDTVIFQSVSSNWLVGILRSDTLPVISHLDSSGS